MKFYKTLFIVTLFCGFVILSIGIYLQLLNQYVGGFTTGRYGIMHYSIVTGFSGIFIGVSLLVTSIWTYRMYCKEKKRFDRMK